MQASRQHTLTQLWIALATQIPALNHDDAREILAAMRREYAAVESDAYAFGFGEGYLEGRDAGRAAALCDAAHAPASRTPAVDSASPPSIAAPAPNRDHADHEAAALAQLEESLIDGTTRAH